MILTIDGREIPPACRNCRVNSDRVSGLCWACESHAEATGEARHHPSIYATSEDSRAAIERAKNKVREMGLKKSPGRPSGNTEN